MNIAEQKALQDQIVCGMLKALFQTGHLDELQFQRAMDVMRAGEEAPE